MAPKKKPAGKSAAAAKPKGKAAPPPKKGKGSKKDDKKKAAVKKDKICAILVRKLDFEGMSHETVKEVFKNCGGIIGVRLRHGKYTLLFFKSQVNAKKALEYNNKTVKGNKIQVMKANRARLPKKREGWCRTIWCGPLPGGTTKKQLRKHFQAAGKIKKVRYYPSKKHGFVYFKKAEDALKAVAMSKIPFSHGKDVSKMEKIPHQLQFKIQVKLSMRTLTGDKLRNEMRFNRRPPSEIERKNQKSAARAALRAAAKAAKESEEKKKASGSGTKKGSATKKDSSTKKGSTSKK